jgi:NAD(P)-dependent dehydrogenase (short-subunit alcohol dehydrogenase family)
MAKRYAADGANVVILIKMTEENRNLFEVIYIQPIKLS